MQGKEFRSLKDLNALGMKEWKRGLLEAWSVFTGHGTMGSKQGTNTLRQQRRFEATGSLAKDRKRNMRTPEHLQER